jgi:hypothetical protein
MSVYVDEIREFNDYYKSGRSRHGSWCHMMTDGDISELHEMAEKIGLHRSWFQNKPRHPHYDLTPGKRKIAIQNGAIECSSIELVRRCIWNKVDDKWEATV